MLYPAQFWGFIDISVKETFLLINMQKFFNSKGSEHLRPLPVERASHHQQEIMLVFKPTLQTLLSSVTASPASSEFYLLLLIFHSCPESDPGFCLLPPPPTSSCVFSSSLLWSLSSVLFPNSLLLTWWMC